MTSISRSRSTTSFFSRAFSVSSCFRRLDVVRLKAPDTLAPCVDRLLADPVPLGHHRHRLAIRLADDRTICSSAKSALRVAPSESGASLSRNSWSEIPGTGHRPLRPKFPCRRNPHQRTLLDQAVSRIPKLFLNKNPDFPCVFPMSSDQLIAAAIKMAQDLLRQNLPRTHTHRIPR
jgi:hypothetical protein